MVEHDVEVFYTKLVQCAGASGKLRWNAICEDLISIYENQFNPKQRQIERLELWIILFDPEKHPKGNKEILSRLMEDPKHRTFFMEILMKGIEDPKDWEEWVGSFRY